MANGNNNQTPDQQKTREGGQNSSPNPLVSRKALWKGLQKRGAYSKSFDEFEQKFNDQKSIDALYQGLVKRNAWTKSYDEFINKFWSDKFEVKKKESEEKVFTEIPTPYSPEYLEQYGVGLTKPSDEVTGPLKQPAKETEQDLGFWEDLGNRFQNMLPTIKREASNANVLWRNFQDKFYRGLENLGLDMSAARRGNALYTGLALATADEAVKDMEPTRPIVESISSGDPDKMASAIIGSMIVTGESILKTLGTYGAYPFIAESSNNYVEALNETAREQGESPLTIFMNDEDKEIAPVAAGVISGALERVMDMKLAGDILKKAPMGFWKKVFDISKSSSREGLTEGIQGVINEIGQNLEGMDVGEAWGQINWDNILEEAVTGALGGGGLTTVSKLIKRKKDKYESQDESGVSADVEGREEEVGGTLQDREGGEQQGETGGVLQEDEGTQVEPVPEQAPEPEPAPAPDFNNFQEAQNKLVNYNGMQGVIKVDEGGKAEFYPFEGDRVYELGRADDPANTEIAKVERVENIVDEDQSINLYGKKFTGYFNENNLQDNITRDDNGNVVSVAVKDEKGNRRTIRGPRAEQIAYESGLLNFFNEHPELTEDQINDFNTAETVKKLIEDAERQKQQETTTGVSGEQTGRTTTQNQAENIGGVQETGQRTTEFTPEEQQEFDRLVAEEKIDNIDQLINDFEQKNRKHFTKKGELKKNAPKNVRTEFEDLLKTREYRDQYVRDELEKRRQRSQPQEDIQQPEGETTATQTEPTPQITEKERAVRNKNNLLDTIQGFNRRSPGQRKSNEAKSLIHSIKLQANDLGYTVKQHSGNKLELFDREGKKVSKTPIREKLPEPTQEDFTMANDFISQGGGPETVGDELGRLNYGMRTAEVKKAYNDIIAGKDSQPARKVIAKIKEWNERGEVDLIQGSGNMAETMAVPMDEYLKEPEDTDGEVYTQNPNEEAPEPTPSPYDDVPFNMPVLNEPEGGKTEEIDESEAIRGEKPKELRDIFLDLRKVIRPKIVYGSLRQGKKFQRRPLGAYFPQFGTIVIRFKGDINVLAHELGHSIDNLFNLRPKIDSKTEKELLKLSETTGIPKDKENDVDYIIGEGMAQAFRGLVITPKNLQKKAPNFYKLYQKEVDQKTKDAIEGFSKDVRTWIGAPGLHQIASTMVWDPQKKKGTIFEALKPNSTDPDKISFTWLDKLNRLFLNAMHPFEKSVRWLVSQKGIKDLKPGANPEVMAHLLLGVTEKMDNIMEKGLVNSKNKYLIDKESNKRMTFSWLVERLDQSSEKTLTEEMKLTASYMIAERTFELGDRFGTDIINGIGSGIVKDKKQAQKALDHFNSLDKPQQERIKESARRYRLYSDRLLKYQVSKGRLSGKDYELISKNNIQYVAFNRFQEAGIDEEIVLFRQQPTIGGKTLASPKQLLYKIKPSTGFIQNPYLSLTQNAYKTIRESDRNEVMQLFRKLIIMPNPANPKNTNQQVLAGEIASPGSKGDDNTITIFVDGKPEYWKINEPDVYKAIKGIHEGGVILPGGFTWLASLTRWTVTMFPVFAARNRFRDFQQRLIVSKTDALKGYDIYKNKQLREDVRDAYQLFGGGQAGYYTLNDNFYERQMRHTVRKLIDDNGNVFTNPQFWARNLTEKYKNLISSSETATRLEEFRSAYKKAKKKGLDDYNANIYAAYQARDLMDFAVGGVWTRVLNQMVPFTNAAVQGLRKNIRTMAEDPRGFTVRFLLYSVAPSVFLRAMVQAFGDEEEYQNLPAWRRDLYYNFPIGNDLWMTIPKPFELGAIGTAPERLMDYLMFGDNNAFEGYAGSLARSTMPIDETTVAGPWRSFLEAAVNYDFFRQKQIVPYYESKLDVRKREGTERASRIGKLMQKITFNTVDARKADHVLAGQLTYFGDFAQRISDIGREESFNKFDLTFLGFFKNDPVYNSLDVQWVNEKAERFGLSNEPYFEHFQFIVQDYFNAKTREEREKRGDLVREFASNVRKVWEEYDIIESSLGNEDNFDRAKSRVKREIRKGYPSGSKAAYYRAKNAKREEERD